MSRFAVGIQLWPQHTTMEELRAAWKAADAAGVDSIWVWDHFYPLSGDDSGPHFEGWSVLAAMAADTSNARLGTLVTSIGYRNPDLLADMARTVDQVSGGRCYLGVGAGWFERDYAAYGYDFGTPASRLADLEAGLPRIAERLSQLNPPPAGRLPILVGGGGEKVTLRLVATYADAWNSFPPLDTYAHKMGVLDRWCEKVGRDPNAIERTVALNSADELERVEEYVKVGATHIIVGLPHPYDMAPVTRLLEQARS
ncbi:MAG: LLM class F420-dependent oxidoreductase [Acidimicrobiia bacterium]